METYNLLLENLDQDADFIKCKEQKGVSLVKKIQGGAQLYTHFYDKVFVLDALHLLTETKGVKKIQRFSFTSEKIPRYVPMQEQEFKDISEYEVIKNTSKTLLLKNKEGFYSYLDYNVNSRFYMLCLTPFCLKEAEEFDKDFKDYAKVMYLDEFKNEKRGYINRDDFYATSKKKIKLYQKEEIENHKVMRKSF